MAHETDESNAALKAKVAELEKQLADAARRLDAKDRELAESQENVRTTRVALDEEKAKSVDARREADTLNRKASELERERDELKRGTGSDTAEMVKSFDKFIEAQTKMMQAQASAVAARESQNPRSAAVTVSDPVSDLSDAELERILAEQRRTREQSLLVENAQVNAITAAAEVAAVGPTLVMDVTIEGETVEAMVDTGSQSTIISRDALHRIGRRLKSQG